MQKIEENMILHFLEIELLSHSGLQEVRNFSFPILLLTFSELCRRKQIRGTTFCASYPTSYDDKSLGKNFVFIWGDCAFMEITPQ